MNIGRLKKVLVANRGEIAVRVILACRELGIPTVAIYSDADLEAPHRALADEAYPLGDPSPEASYLNIDKIVEIAKRSGSKSVHPGYGFLAENPHFAAACKDSGLVFIGPGSRTMEELGDKANAKLMAIDAQVPVIKGRTIPSGEPSAVEREVKAAAEEIGYPLMIKAASGGGGKGMRVVRVESELFQSFMAAQREALGAFGDDKMMVERWVEAPRHIEIQFAIDLEGNAVYLPERDCSIQRRHQKIIEETPAVDSLLRAKMGEMALRLVKAANYTNVGTVEFLLSPSGEFFFLEVNTRLQVEHPITEMVTGLDLVKSQLSIAAGHPMSLKQEDIAVNGHAIEARICAEDPAHDFVPSPGVIRHIYKPHIPRLRIDSGIRKGQTIPPVYDSLLAKVIAWSADRRGAISRLSAGLADLSLLGVVTNRSYLLQILATPDYLSNEVHTGFVAKHPFDEEETVPDFSVAAIAASLLTIEGDDQTREPSSGRPRHDPWTDLRGWRAEQ